MYNTDFTAWLYGYIALSKSQPASICWTAAEKRIVKAHVNLVHEATHGELTITNDWIRQDLDGVVWQDLVDLVGKQFQQKPIISGVELAYFLQGYFEISQPRRKASSDINSRGLARQQADSILFQMERNVDGMHSTLRNLYWKLRDFVDDPSGPETFATDATEAALNSMFQHVIDNSYGFDEATHLKLQAIHDEYKST